MSHTNYITQNPAVRSNEKCLTGTRLTITDVVDITRQGEKDDYHLTQEQIDACSQEEIYQIMLKGEY
jgi:uncharacterized protein (DUF433 family)